MLASVLRKGKRGAALARPTPLPGRPVRGSATGRPIMALLDLLGRRWALRILWELRTGEPTFRELQRRCDAVSSSVLSGRLRELSEAGIVGHTGTGYALTAAGHDLLARLHSLNEWAARWQPASDTHPTRPAGHHEPAVEPRY